MATSIEDRLNLELVHPEGIQAGSGKDWRAFSGYVLGLGGEEAVHGLGMLAGNLLAETVEDPTLLDEALFVDNLGEAVQTGPEFKLFKQGVRLAVQVNKELKPEGVAA